MGGKPREGTPGQELFVLPHQTGLRARSCWSSENVLSMEGGRQEQGGKEIHLNHIFNSERKVQVEGAVSG